MHESIYQSPDEIMAVSSIDSFDELPIEDHLDDTEARADAAIVSATADENLDRPIPSGRWRMNLSRAAAVALCSAAMGTMTSTERASAEAQPAIAVKRVVDPVKTGPVRVDNASDTGCGYPGYAAPNYQQLGTMRCLIDNARSIPLADDPTLDQAAGLKTDDQIRCGTLLAPIDHDACGNSPFAHFPDGWGHMGEILAWGEQTFGTARSIFGAWRRSPTHWQVITNDRFSSLGLVLKRVKGIAYWAGEFGGS